MSISQRSQQIRFSGTTIGRILRNEFQFLVHWQQKANQEYLKVFEPGMCGESGN